MEAIETLSHASCEIKIYFDDDAESPREWDNAGTMVCWHNRYTLGDSNGLEQCKDDIRASKSYRESWEDYSNDNMLDLDQPADLHTAMTRCNFLILNLYLYEHSGITMSTAGFSCPWDSGQVGFIYMTPETAIEEWGKKILAKQVREKAIRCMENEVEIYDQYLTGQVYGYDVSGPNGEQNSYWGLYGLDYCIEEAKTIAESIRRHAIKAAREAAEQDRIEHLALAKTLIKNRVPLEIRATRLQA